MRIQFVSNYYPPEVNAPASRLSEHVKVWQSDGISVQVVTSVPNFPEGKVYEGYHNTYTQEKANGVEVFRVPMYVTANKGTLKRTFSFISFMISAWWYGRKLQKPDLVVATSPQFFAAFAGYFLSRRFKVPFILEIRDLWPESIVAVGAVKRNAIIRFFEKLELFLYKKADHIVALTNAFKVFIQKKGIDPQKISVIKNGADLDQWSQPIDEEKLNALKQKLGLNGKFVASYIGTIGMAHKTDTLLEAARLSTDPDIVFMIIGTGAEREKIQKLKDKYGLTNFVLGEKVSKEDVRYILEITDVSIVHLKKSDLFKTVIPSKIFEAMACRRPIVIGVEGEAKAIIDDSQSGIAIEPENAEELANAVERLKSDPNLYKKMAMAGYEYVTSHYDRKKLAKRYVNVFKEVIK